MQVQFENALIYTSGSFRRGFARMGEGACRFSFAESLSSGDAVVSMPGDHLVILPALIDVHVHLREPGFSYKETILSGTTAALHSGYSALCAMPNLKPVPDSPAHLAEETAIIRRDAVTRVFPYAAITKGEMGEELSPMEALSDAIAFSDDGRGVQSAEMMAHAMEKAASLGKIIAAHCEDNALLHGGYIHDGAYAKKHGHKGICSESEWGPIARDLALAEQTGCRYHVCHISTKESVDLIRRAKARGVDVTCETAPHYLLLDESDLQEDGRFKMNPPLRQKADRLALLEGLRDGTIDMIATDHAPHSAEEKSRGLEKSAMGIVGLETAFPLLYTYLVKPGVIPLEKLTELMSLTPAKRFGIANEGNFAVFDCADEYTIDPERFLSRGRATPFAGWRVRGRCVMSVLNGQIAYSAIETEAYR